MSNCTSERLKEPNITHDIFSCELVYDPSRSLSALHTSQCLEICMIVAGNGIHLVMDQAIPCKAGDIYVTPSGTPHRYMLENERDSLTVRRLRFDVAEWFDSDISDPLGQKYCYGMFNDDSVTACAMLNVYMREKIDALYDAVECEMA